MSFPMAIDDNFMMLNGQKKPAQFPSVHKAVIVFTHNSLLTASHQHIDQIKPDEYHKQSDISFCHLTTYQIPAL